MPYALKEFTPRIYQEVIAAQAIAKNTLVILPTGLGKTAISMLVSLHTLNTSDKKVIMVAPTKPLVEQHYKTFLERSTIAPEDCTFFTGTISPEKRSALFSTKQLFFSTPQVIENDVVGGRIDLTGVGLLIIDEAHRATGNYSYVWLVRQLLARNPAARILSMTASPGTDAETIEEICKNLHVEWIESRTPEDPDVKPYVEETVIHPVYVRLPDSFAAISNTLNKCFTGIITEIKRYNVFQTKLASQVTKKDLLMLQGSLRGEMSQGNFDKDVIAAISLGAMAIKVMHAQELIESQGLASLQSYFADVEDQARKKQSKAVVQLMINPLWRLAIKQAKECKDLHPKLHKLHDVLVDLLEKKPDAKAIVFSQYRDTLQRIAEHLETVSGVHCQLFFGQAKKNGTGMSQKEQQRILAAFSAGEFNVACMSSVGEEGLDIPAVDLVVFYEPIPSAIRTIQRRGRTGRHEEGNVIILIAKGTRDEAYRWVAHHKEKNMHKLLDVVKKRLHLAENKNSGPQRTLSAIHTPRRESVGLSVKSPTSSISEIQTTPSATVVPAHPPEKKTSTIIYADSREMHNTAIKLLVEQGVGVKMTPMDVGDIVVSSRCGIEFKKTEDFVDSILDGRLLEQIKALKQSYDRPLIIIEGDNLYSTRNVHPHAIMGMLSTITVSYGIPVLSTSRPEQTAMLIKMIATREQEEVGSVFTPHASRKPKTAKEMQEYLVSSLPGIGTQTARRLLLHFRTVKQLVDASVEELEQVDGVGKKTASELYVFFRTAYRQ